MPLTHEPFLVTDQCFKFFNSYIQYSPCTKSVLPLCCHFQKTTQSQDSNVCPWPCTQGPSPPGFVPATLKHNHKLCSFSLSPGALILATLKQMKRRTATFFKPTAVCLIPVQFVSIKHLERPYPASTSVPDLGSTAPTRQLVSEEQVVAWAAGDPKEALFDPISFW